MTNFNKIAKDLEVLTGNSWIYKSAMFGLGRGKLIVEVLSPQDRIENELSRINDVLERYNINNGRLKELPKAFSAYYFSPDTMNNSTIERLHKNAENIKNSVKAALKYISGLNWSYGPEIGSAAFPCYTLQLDDEESAIKFFDFFKACGVGQGLIIEGNLLIYRSSIFNNLNEAQKITERFDNFKQAAISFFRYICCQRVDYASLGISEPTINVSFDRGKTREPGYFSVSISSFDVAQIVYKLFNGWYNGKCYLVENNKSKAGATLKISVEKFAIREICSLLQQITCRRWEYVNDLSQGKGYFQTNLLQAPNVESKKTTLDFERQRMVNNFKYMGITELRDDMINPIQTANELSSSASERLYLFNPDFRHLSSKVKNIQEEVILVLSRITHKQWQVSPSDYDNERRGYFYCEIHGFSESEITSLISYLIHLREFGIQFSFEIWQEGKRFDENSKYLGAITSDSLDNDRIVIRYHEMIQSISALMMAADKLLLS